MRLHTIEDNNSELPSSIECRWESPEGFGIPEIPEESKKDLRMWKFWNLLETRELGDVRNVLLDLLLLGNFALVILTNKLIYKHEMYTNYSQGCQFFDR